MKCDITIPVHADWGAHASLFAQESFESRKRKIATRNQTNKTKILHDITCGTIAEFAVWHFLESCGLRCTEPDLNIYQPKHKTFDADLKVGTSHIHVKSYSNPRWASWVFQRASWDTDPLVQEPHPNHYLVLTETTLQQCTIKYVIHQPDVVEKFEDPIVWQLRNTKTVLYPKTLDTVEFTATEFLNSLRRGKTQQEGGVAESST